MRKTIFSTLESELGEVPIRDHPNLKESRVFFSIDSFFYKWALIKKIISKGNFFFYNTANPETKLRRANLLRFNKPKRKEWLYVSGVERNVNKSILLRILPKDK